MRFFLSKSESIYSPKFFFVVLFIFCAGLGRSDAREAVILNGAGATFPAPLYEKWIDAYEEETGKRVTYKARGSGEGIRLLLAKAVDFGATDAMLSDEDLARQKTAILHLPTCLGAVAVTYHLPARPELKLNRQIVADLFLGTITHWSDQRIRRLNPDLHLPAIPINVVHRSDSSGTSFVFTDYLSRISPKWRLKVGRGKIVKWPSGVGADGNSGVVTVVRKIEGSIGYVSLGYAEKHHLPVAMLENKSGNYVRPTLEAVTAAADVELPEDTRMLITDSPSVKGYPISAFTYLIFYREQEYLNRSRDRAKTLDDFFRWIIGPGQAYTRALYYAPLPESVVPKARRIIDALTYGKRPLR